MGHRQVCAGVDWWWLGRLASSEEVPAGESGLTRLLVVLAS